MSNETVKTKVAEMRETYSKFIARKVMLIIVSIAMLVGIVILASSLGAAHLSVKSVFNAIFSKIFPFIESNSWNETVVWHLRLPRVVMGAVAGIGLGISGAAMQGTLRNPLASPFTLGISSAAAFGASIAIMFGIGFTGSGTYIIVLNAFISALACAFLVYTISWIRGVTPETIILAGIALMYFFSALTATLQYIASEQQLQAVMHWTFGSLTKASWNGVFLVSIILGVSLVFLMRYAWAMNECHGFRRR